MRRETQDFLEKLKNLERREKAALRRELGRPLSRADGKALSAFYTCLPSSVEGPQEEIYFGVASIFCLWALSDKPEAEEAFEKALARLMKRRPGSAKYRLESLLSQHWDEEGRFLYLLTPLVRLVWQWTEVKIDFGALLEDLLAWEDDKKVVQRRWARTAFGGNEFYS